MKKSKKVLTKVNASAIMQTMKVKQVQNFSSRTSELTALRARERCALSRTTLIVANKFDGHQSMKVKQKKQAGEIERID